jgi:hypothetical protein
VRTMELLEEIANSRVNVEGCLVKYSDLKYLDKNEIKKLSHYIDKINRVKKVRK